jgi:hypothetical protein
MLGLCIPSSDILAAYAVDSYFNSGDLTMEHYIQALKTRLDALKNPYLYNLRAGDFQRDDFVETQIQFLFAVVFFSRPMLALAGRLGLSSPRVSIIANAFEEHGEGNLNMSHEQTFRTLLSRLGIDRATIETKAEWPEVRSFNTALSGVCVLDDVYTGLAALGIIEDLFAGISADIGRSIVGRAWLEHDELVHYTAHEVLDIEHAEGFYTPLREAWAAHPRHAYQIQQGLELGGYIFMNMYEGLYRQRQRRWERETSGPHSLVGGWYLPPKRPISPQVLRSTSAPA